MEEGVYSKSNLADVLTMQNLDDTARSINQQNLVGNDNMPASPNAMDIGQFPRLSNRKSDMAPFESHAEPSSKPEEEGMMMATQGVHLREESQVMADLHYQTVKQSQRQQR